MPIGEAPSPSQGRTRPIPSYTGIQDTSWQNDEAISAVCGFACRPARPSGQASSNSLARWMGQKASKAPGNSSIMSLIYEPAVVLSGQASLIMRNLRTKRRENVGWGYRNQTSEGQRE